MEFILKLIAFVIFFNWTIAMHLLTNSSSQRSIRYVALMWAVAFTVICGFLVIP